MKRIIECVPNFSEGVDLSIIQGITAEITAVTGVKLLNVDAGKGANRTVVTFAGGPEAVIEAAFLAIKKAGELIDMRNQRGEHPRMGATDVCPLIPISNISMGETVTYATALAKRVGDELAIPVYLYGYAQPDEKRSDLSVIREGEYEGFFKKINLPGWLPDFGPTALDAKRGATVIGARNMLVAYNVNLDTALAQIANAIALEVRESGKIIQQQGKKKRVPGTLKNVKAIGWYIAEYGKAQVSMNLTNLQVTPMHRAYEEVCKKAQAYGVKVTGSELIGMIPLQAMLAAGYYFLQKKNITSPITERQLIEAAVIEMGLDELFPFEPEKRIIEYMLG